MERDSGGGGRGCLSRGKLRYRATDLVEHSDSVLSLCGLHPSQEADQWSRGAISGSMSGNGSEREDRLRLGGAERRQTDLLRQRVNQVCPCVGHASLHAGPEALAVGEPFVLR